MNYDLKSLDYVDYIYKCEKHGDVEYALPRHVDNSKPTCPTCDDEAEEVIREAEKQKRRVRRYQECGIAPKYLEKEYKHFIPKTQAQKIAQITLHNYGKKFSTANGNLTIVGKMGTGKTRLASALAKQVINGGNTCELRKLKYIFMDVRASWDRGSKDFEQAVYSRYLDIDLLIIDEVGVGNGSQNERDIALALIDLRYEHNLPTIIISNVQPEQLEKYIDERSVSRLAENGSTVIIDGVDCRTGV